jgi:hypothetical protein
MTLWSWREKKTSIVSGFEHRLLNPTIVLLKLGIYFVLLKGLYGAVENLQMMDKIVVCAVKILRAITD